MTLNRRELRTLKALKKADKIHKNTLIKILGVNGDARLARLLSDEIVSYVLLGYNDPVSTAGFYQVGFPVYSEEIFLTDKGKILLEDTILKKRVDFRKGIGYWVRYGLTTLIAVTALINSILARLGQ